MKVRVKHLIIIIFALGAMAVYVGVSLAADGPSAFVRYYTSGSNVVAAVYFDDTGGYNCRVGSDVTDDGGDLQWSADLTKVGSGANAYVTATLTKYKNYYFKIYNGSNVTMVRAFPVDFNNATNPDRKQNDYAHGNFTPDTSMCANCHSTHAALKAQLLKQATYYELCMLCHGTSTSQSKYDVERGMVYMGPGYGTAGWVSSLAGPIKSGAGLAVSKHDVDGVVESQVYVPGSEQSTSRLLTFTCVSCHNGHGGKNDNYRLLKKTIYPADGWNPQAINFTAYAVVKDFTVGEEVYFVSGNSEFCAACHLDYDEGNAGTKGGAYASYYRHPVTVGSTVYSVFSTLPAKDYYPTTGDYLPLQYSATAESKTVDKRTAVVCETCHFAHGSTKSFSVYLPPDGTAVSNQKMLRLDNYGVCESCHKK